MIEIDLSDDETMNSNENQNQNNKKNEKENVSLLPPSFYCKICEKEFDYKSALMHLKNNINIHQKDCMISEEIIKTMENELINNLLNKLEQKKNDINIEQKKVYSKMKKINELEIYIYQTIEMMKTEYNKLYSILEEEKTKNKLIKEKIILFIDNNKDIKGVINKYNQLTDFNKLQSQLNNIYFNKNFSKEKIDSINKIQASFINKINSLFNSNINKNNNNNNQMNNNKSLSLKDELNLLNVEELKALNNMLKENEISSSDIVIEINKDEFNNILDKKNLKAERKRCSINIDK